MLTFECLPNEIFVELFQYFDIVELLKSFHKLNSRFNELVFDQSRRCALNFSLISAQNFDEFCLKILPLINDRIKSCRFSDEIPTENLSKFFVKLNLKMGEFRHLKSLSIDQIYSFELLNEVTSQLRELEFLTHLRLKIDNRQGVEREFTFFLTNIWSLPQLTHVDLILNFYEGFLLFDMKSPSNSIRWINLAGFPYNPPMLNYLLKYTPNLKHLGLETFNVTLDIDKFVYFPPLISLQITFRHSIDLMKLFFSKLPNIRSLNLRLERSSFDGKILEKFFRENLPNLVELRLLIFVEFPVSGEFEDHVDRFLETFRSDFWLVEHRWFVRCHWTSFNFQRRAFLHTIPFPSDLFIFFDGIQTKSTEIDDEQQRNPFVNVRTLTHIQRGREITTNFVEWPFPFRSIRHLTLTFPLPEHFSSIVPTFDQLTFLNVTMNKQFAYSQLQNILDRSSRLYSLRFVCPEDFSMKNFQLRSQSIRQLEFCRNSIFTSDYFTVDECLQFTMTPIASQLEFLTIDVKNHNGVFKLIKQMSKLRALRVKCGEDLLQNFSNESVQTIRRNPLKFDEIDLILL